MVAPGMLIIFCMFTDPFHRKAANARTRRIVHSVVEQVIRLSMWWCTNVLMARRISPSQHCSTSDSGPGKGGGRGGVREFVEDASGGEVVEDEAEFEGEAIMRVVVVVVVVVCVCVCLTCVASGWCQSPEKTVRQKVQVKCQTKHKRNSIFDANLTTMSTMQISAQRVIHYIIKILVASLPTFRFCSVCTSRHHSVIAPISLRPEEVSTNAADDP